MRKQWILAPKCPLNVVLTCNHQERRVGLTQLTMKLRVETFLIKYSRDHFILSVILYFGNHTSHFSIISQLQSWVSALNNIPLVLESLVMINKLSNI